LANLGTDIYYSIGVYITVTTGNADKQNSGALYQGGIELSEAVYNSLQ